LGSLVGIADTRYIAILLLLAIGAILTLGPILYKTVEKIAMFLIVFGVPGIFILTLFLAEKTDWAALAGGLVGRGEGYFLLPAGIPIASFLAAFAFSGAGGNLNLAQSFYIKEKGYGMGKFSGRITSILTGKVESIKLEGARFEMNKENLNKFKDWWKVVNLEHLLIFWATGAFTICLLGLLAYSTAFGATTPAAGINFVLYEAAAIAQKTLPIFGTLFLLIGGVMLFSTQMTVLDATSRIMSENLLILKRRSWEAKSLPKIYYSFLWAQIAFGIVIFLLGFGEPLLLLTLAAVINAGAMFVHIALTLILNLTKLEKEVRPSLIRISMMVFSLLFFGYFTLRTIINIL